MPEETWLSLHGMPAVKSYFSLLRQATEDGVVDTQEQSSITALWAPDINPKVGVKKWLLCDNRGTHD